MEFPGPINISEYNYDLPDERIARFPLKERDDSMLLTCISGDIGHRSFKELPELIPDKSLMVFNDTKVVRARLMFRKETGAEIEVFCLEPLDPSDYQLAFSAKESVEWKCLVGNAKKWKEKDIFTDIRINGKISRIYATRTGQDGNSFSVRFRWNEPELTFGEILESAGVIPIPPYLQREAVKEDNFRYQTVYSRIKGSVAAPTAGLHFTERILTDIDSRGIKKAQVTLHVGAGTFVPVKEEDATKHRMHEELAIVDIETIKEFIKYYGKIISVGTTTTRTLESLYFLGVKFMNGYVPSENEPAVIEQWDPYRYSYDKNDTKPLDAVIKYLLEKKSDHIILKTGIMITPGYRFKMTNGMVTNFHQPGSTLLLLIAAFIGARWRDVYKYALQNGFRFLSYGDSSFLIP